jgi:glucosamine-phosphate N-acetyltransferase
LALKELAVEKGCYKVILDCSDSNVSFYEKCGFSKTEIMMRYPPKNK